MTLVKLEADLLLNFPTETVVAARDVTRARKSRGRVLVVLDDDPTGTQSVADLPVLTRWEIEDFEWAFTYQIGGKTADAVYVLTNTRSLDPCDVEIRNREVVVNALAAATITNTLLGFVSRSDSTLRGHYPLEPDVIAATLQERIGQRTDGVVIVPAFPDAGRVTIGGVHYMRQGGGIVTPVADTEFAKDPSFGFRNSEISHYIEEKSSGRFMATDVILLDLTAIRGGARGIADAIDGAIDSTPIVADIVTENDLRALSLGLAEAELRGKKLLYRVGPPFVRARIGQEVRAPLTSEDIFAGVKPRLGGGLIVVGPPGALPPPPLHVLTANHNSAITVEIDVEALLDESLAKDHVAEVIAATIAGLDDGDVILHTSRQLVKSNSPVISLSIARAVSAALVEVVNRTLKIHPPRFVIAKGGITSSDVATQGLEIRRAVVRGPILSGIVSLWEPVGGPAEGIPYIVFAGNVGNDSSLLEVVEKLSYL